LTVTKQNCKDCYKPKLYKGFISQNICPATC
jgi:hypothetical protein